VRADDEPAPPPGHGIGLREAADREEPVEVGPHLGDGGELGIVEDHLVIDLIGDDGESVLIGQIGESLDLGPVHH
jgi:hypothetical protein